MFFKNANTKALENHILRQKEELNKLNQCVLRKNHSIEQLKARLAEARKQLAEHQSTTTKSSTTKKGKKK